MLYYVLKFFMFFVLRIYFRRIYVTGLENLCHGKPVVLASSHPNSFNDAFLLGTMLNRSLNYLARSDVFKTALLRRIFRSFHMMPIYRIQEGKENLSRNRDTFDHCYSILEKKGVVLIYAEGLCVQEKRLRKLKKGTARIGFGAMERGTDDIQVVPVGLNYTYPAKFRGEAMISIGRPISLDNFRDIYNVTPALAFKQLNEKLDNALRNEMVIIDKPESEELADRLLIMLRNNLHWPFLQWRFKDRSRLEYEQRACASVNNLLANDSDAFRQLEADVQTYFLKLETQQLDDRNVAGKCTPMALVLFGWLLLPFHLCGAVFRFLPFAISRYLTGRTVKSIEFYGSVLLSIGFLAYLLQLIAVFVIICCFFGILWALPAIPVILISGYVNVYAEEVWRDWLSDRRFREFKSHHSAKVEKLVSMRKGILKDAGLLSHPVEG